MTTPNTPATVEQHSGDLVGTTADRGVHRPGDISAYTDTERDRLRALMDIEEASDADLYMLGEVARRAGLDPFLKEIYLVGRRTKTGGYRGEPERWETKWTVQVGIDGFRNVLRRFATEQGSASRTETTYYDESGQGYPIWIRAFGHHPAAVQVTVTVGDHSASAVAVWEEYVQTKKNGDPNSMWAQYPSVMLAKCAEAAAIRRVCPLTAGMYEPAEIGARKVESQRMDVQPTGGGAVSAIEAARSRMHARQDDQAPVDVSEMQEAPAVDAQAVIDGNAMLRELLDALVASRSEEEMQTKVGAHVSKLGDDEAALAVLREAWTERAAELAAEVQQ